MINDMSKIPGKIYIASKTVHAPAWRALRAYGYPISSTWIDEAGIGETEDFADLWLRCIKEASEATVLIIHRDPDEVLKGAFVEVGAALANGVPVLAVGLEEFSVSKHPLVTNCLGFNPALELAVEICHGGATS